MAITPALFFVKLPKNAISCAIKLEIIRTGECFTFDLTNVEGTIEGCDLLIRHFAPIGQGEIELFIQKEFGFLKAPLLQLDCDIIG